MVMTWIEAMKEFFERPKACTRSRSHWGRSMQSKRETLWRSLGWPYFAMEPRGIDPLGDPLSEIQIADGVWILAVLADLSP
jgi:hypothetical protein